MRLAVVTGAGRGIGRAIAIRLAADGLSVVLGGRDQEALRETAEKLDGEGFPVPLDVSDEGSVVAFANGVHQRFGSPEVVVCNSGVGGPTAPLWELDLAGWEETFAVNVTGTFLTLRAFLPGMIARGNGSAVLIGSMTGKRPLAGRTPYAAGKSALVGLARTLALEAGPYGVRVNVVSPGFVEGPRLGWVIEAQAATTGTEAESLRARLQQDVPLRSFVAAEDVADAVAFLASEKARSVTGADLNVTGGLVMY